MCVTAGDVVCMTPPPSGPIFLARLVFNNVGGKNKRRHYRKALDETILVPSSLALYLRLLCVEVPKVALEIARVCSVEGAVSAGIRVCGTLSIPSDHGETTRRGRRLGV